MNFIILYNIFCEILFLNFQLIKGSLENTSELRKGVIRRGKEVEIISIRRYVNQAVLAKGCEVSGGEVSTGVERR